MQQEDINETKSRIQEFGNTNFEEEAERLGYAEGDLIAIACYYVFQLRAGTSKSGVKKRYRTLALHFHPDKMNEDASSNYILAIIYCNQLLAANAPEEDQFEEWENLLKQTEDEDDSDEETINQDENQEDVVDNQLAQPLSKSYNLRSLKKELDDNEYYVESILDKRGRGKKVEYLIKWLGYEDSKDNTWVPIGKCKCHELIKEFEVRLKKTKQKEKSKPSRSSRAKTASVKPIQKRGRKRKATRGLVVRNTGGKRHCVVVQTEDGKLAENNNDT